MATASHARAVKSLNQGPGRRRFVFKTFSQRIEEIEIDVYRSIQPLNSEPSEGSSFFRDCLIEWRELNTAEDFISFYEEMMPLVQTLPQIILNKEMILSALISRLQIQGRLSLEPILRLTAALSRDLLEDFPPFLQMIAESLASLLKGGADREPEIIEQIFTSWSYIMMYLQKYLVRDVVHVLRVTAELRYYPQEFIQEFMAESVSFLLRNAPFEQLKRGTRKVMDEVAKQPLRKTGVSALLWYVMRGVSSKLHSKAGKVLLLLLDHSILDIGDKFPEGSESVLEVVTEILQRVCEELEPSELNLMWDCLYEKITDAASSGSLIHLRRLLSLMISTVQVEYIRKLSDYQQLLQVVSVLMQKFLLNSTIMSEDDQYSGVVDRVLELMLCTLDGLHLADIVSFIVNVAVQWAPVFELRISSLLTFIRKLLLKDSQVVHAFSNNIIRALDGLIESNKEEVVFLLLLLCEKLHVQVQSSSFLGIASKNEISRICSYLENSIVYWTGNINKFIQDDSVPIGLCESKLALSWGVISCYSCMKEIQASPAPLLAAVDALDQHLMTETEDVPGFPNKSWQALIGAALSSCNKLLPKNGFSDELVSKILQLAMKYRSSSQVLSGVADLLDSLDRSQVKEGSSISVCHPWLQVEKIMDSLSLLSENLCHPDKAIRLSTLRILCHYVSLSHEQSLEAQLTENKMKSDIQVLHHLLSIEETHLSVSTSRSVCLLISRIQMDLSAGRVSDSYLPSVFFGIIGIFHNRFSAIWQPAMECLAFLIRNKFNVVGYRIIQYLEESQSYFLKQCQSQVLASQDQFNRDNPGSTSEGTDLLCRFRSFVSPVSDSTPSTTVLCLLIESLQKVAELDDLWTKDIVPLFLKFMGYNLGVASVTSFNPDLCKGKDWNCVLKEWLNLLKLNRGPKSLKGSEFLKEVLQYRLLDEMDAEIQMTVLDCLLKWKDNYLLPYEQHLKNLINSTSMREEMAIWSLSRESNLIKECHRTSLIPIVIRVLVPKVRKPKILASRKHTSVPRKAILGFLAQLDVDELRHFFALLIKPLLSLPLGIRGTEDWFLNSSEESDEFNSSSILVHFTLNNIVTLSWKQRSGFLHVIEDILLVFDKFRVEPFLDLLMGCVVRLLASCMSTLGSDESSGLAIDDRDEQAEDQITNNPNPKSSKELRSLCLKVISLVLNKYEDHLFDIEFWDLFFASVKPLTVCFKQGGASSEKPSSLFSCFLAMSRSCNLVSFLYKEENLVPDMLSILTVQTASEAVLSCVLEFIENLLNLDNDVDNEDSDIKKLLLPNIGTLICSLHSHFKFNNPARRRLIKHPGERELNIFKLLSKYVKDPSAAGKFVDIMLPLLTTGIQNSDACLEALQVIRSIVRVLANERTPEILDALSALLVSAGVDIRISICDLLDALAASDSSLIALAKLIRELNATSAMEIGGLDLDIIINAYGKINKDLFYSIGEKHTLVILSHAVHDMSSPETILRESAYGLLLSFVDFSAKIHAEELMDDDQNSWSEKCIQKIITKFLLRHAGNAMSKDAASRGVWIDLLRVMVLKLQKVPSLQSFRALCNEDAEQDFFYNIKHVQKHRVARALSRFKGFVSAGESVGIANKVFLPLFLDMLLNLQNGKGENIRSACIEALASISSKMEWPSYYAFLMRCFRELTLKSDKKKVLLRLICSVLDHFHFLEISSGEEAGVSLMDISKADTMDRTASTALPTRGSPSASEVQACLKKDVLPKIQKLLESDSDNVNVSVSLVALKLLKLLPGDVMELQLPGIIQRISNFLKHRLESIRDEARLALSSCLKELGMEYLKFVLRVLKATLKRGYELHVLGYTLNSILSKCLAQPISGKLDYCLEELLSVVEHDILGDVSEQKEVEKIASRMKETGKCKSFETLKLIAQNITFKTHALKLLSPVTANLQKSPTPKLKSKLDSMLKHIADGIECNPSVNEPDMFIFIYGLIEDSTTSGAYTDGSSSDVKLNKQFGAGSKAGTLGRLIDVGPDHCHLVTGFALGLLYNCMKRKNINKKDEQMLSMLDPFVRVLTGCLTSKFEDVIGKSLQCLALVVGLPLPSLESVAESMKTSVLVIAQGSTDGSKPLVQSCLSLLTVLLRKTRITLSADQLHMIIQFPVFVDIEKNSSFVALSLLKAIVNRKLVVPEIYDLVTRVGELMVTHQVESFRRKCSQILLQFLLDYHLSEKRLQQHLDFLLSNLRYEHSTGRESVLEMIHAIVMKFPKAILDEYSRTIFLNLVVCLANDHDKKVRSMTGAAIKLLIGRVSSHSMHSILEYSLSWYLDKNRQLWGAAAQVLGLLAEAMKDFKKHVNGVLPAMRSIFHSAVNVLTDPEIDHSDEARIPLWKEAYYSLVMLEKILYRFPEICLSKDLEDTWEIICEFLVHPHLWLRNVSNRLIAVYFASVTAANRETCEKSLGSFFLMRPSRLLLIALYLCYQLKGTIDNAGSALVIQNLAFTICCVHSFSQTNKSVGTHGYWSTLDENEEGRLLKAFQLLDSGKGKSMFASLTSHDTTERTQEENDQHKPSLLSYLLRRMGKIAMQMESDQMKVVFSILKTVSPKIIGSGAFDDSDDLEGHAYQIMLPLYKVCEGYAGKVIPDDVKQLAQEAHDSVRVALGMNYSRVYMQVAKSLKSKRDKRRHEEKVMAVVNPMRNAKRKLRIAAKSRANKKRKIMTMRMAKWMH